MTNSPETPQVYDPATALSSVVLPRQRAVYLAHNAYSELCSIDTARPADVLAYGSTKEEVSAAIVAQDAVIEWERSLRFKDGGYFSARMAEIMTETPGQPYDQERAVRALFPRTLEHAAKLRLRSQIERERAVQQVTSLVLSKCLLWSELYQAGFYLQRGLACLPNSADSKPTMWYRAVHRDRQVPIGLRRMGDSLVEWQPPVVSQPRQ